MGLQAHHGKRIAVIENEFGEVGIDDNLVKAGSLASKLDGVMIETTGLADPAPVAQTFFADDFVQQHMRLDGILTLVDAAHIIQHLDDEKPEGVENEAVEQIAFADRILLNKTDLVEDESELVEVERRIRAINESVAIKRTINSEVDMDFILGIHAFSLDKILEQDDAFLADNAEHQHDPRVSSVGIEVA